jgi:hypothetical protein
MDATLDIGYSFNFSNGPVKEFTLSLDRRTLLLTPRKKGVPPPWTELKRHCCIVCRLHGSAGPYCPIALNMADIVEEFKEYLSIERVRVTVTTAERSYAKETTLQEGLSSLVGIVMVTSGCPVMELLKPMVRFHLPFATLEETEFRMVSMFLVAQFYRQQKGLAADWKLEGLKRIYAEVEQVNRTFADRLYEAAENDANINALVKLDCFAKSVPRAAAQMMKDLLADYAAHLV